MREASGVDHPGAPWARMLTVEVDELVLAGAAFFLRGPRSDVGPFLQQDLVVSLDLAVGLVSLGPGLLHGGPGLGARPVQSPDR